MGNLRPLSLEVYKIWISLDRNLRPHIGAFPPLKKTDQRLKDSLDTLAVPVKRPVGGADVTLAVYALVRLLFSFKRLRSTYLGREKIQQQQHQYPASFFFLTFFVLVTVVGNTLREQLPHVKDSLGFWIPRPGFQIPGTGFRSLLVKFGFLIPISNRVLYPLSCIPDSKAQDSRFHKKKFPGFWNPDFLDMEREEEAPAVNALVFPFSTISGSA